VDVQEAVSGTFCAVYWRFFLPGSCRNEMS